MYKWNVNYRDFQNGVIKHFQVKASSKQQATEKAVTKMSDRNLNHFTISLVTW